MWRKSSGNTNVEPIEACLAAPQHSKMAAWIVLRFNLRAASLPVWDPVRMFVRCQSATAERWITYSPVSAHHQFLESTSPGLDEQGVGGGPGAAPASFWGAVLRRAKTVKSRFCLRYRRIIRHHHPGLDGRSISGLSDDTHPAIERIDPPLTTTCRRTPGELPGLLRPPARFLTMQTTPSMPPPTSFTPSAPSAPSAPSNFTPNLRLQLYQRQQRAPPHQQQQ